MKSEAELESARAAVIPNWSTVRRVLFVRLRSIGDTVLMTPCLSALKSWKPDVHLAVASEPTSIPLLEGHSLVDDLIEVGSGFASRASAITRLRRNRFDVAFNLHGGSTAMMIAALSGAKWTTAYRGHHYSSLLNSRAPSPDLLLKKSEIHSVEQQLALLYWSGVEPLAARPRLSLPEPDDAIESLARKLESGGSPSDLLLSRYALVAPGASLESKRWHIEGFVKVADDLSDRGLQTLVVAGPGQEHLADDVSRRGKARPPRITGLLLRELMALIKGSTIFVGNDGGPMHIAAAYRRPLVAIFGSSNPVVWRPWTDAPHAIIAAPHGDISRIQASEVMDAVADVLTEAGNAMPGGLR